MVKDKDEEANVLEKIIEGRPTNEFLDNFYDFASYADPIPFALNFLENLKKELVNHKL
jgi:hypothetical protein